MKPLALTIAGSDSSGGAGLQADLAAFAKCGCAGATVVTAVTAQTPAKVYAWEAVSVELVRQQLRAVLDELKPAAAKTGMLATTEIVEAVAEEIRARPRFPLVVDPVAVATSGGGLLRADGLEAIRRSLLPLAALTTPNSAEIEGLTSLPARNPDEAETAARRLLESGVSAVLVTGGHFLEALGTDVLTTQDGTMTFETEPVPGADVHGTGCTLSAAIAAALARGQPLDRAVREGKRIVTEKLREGTGG